MTRWYRVGSALMAITIGSCGAGGAPPAEDGEASAPPRIRFDVDRMKAEMWWNEEAIVAALELGEGQREQLGRHLERYFADLERSRQLRRSAQADLESAINSGAVAAADEALARLDEAGGLAASGQSRLRAHALLELSAEQRQTLEARWPHLARRPWVQLSQGQMQRGARPRRRAAADADP